MKITQRPPTGLSDIGGSTAIGNAAEGDSAQRHRSGDRVELSHGARLRAQLRRDIGDINQVNDVEVDRVQALRAEIASGTYHRDSHAVAERFLTDVAGELLT